MRSRRQSISDCWRRCFVAFSSQQKFDDAQEAVPVETITDRQFSQIMKGEKTRQGGDRQAARRPRGRGRRPEADAAHPRGQARRSGAAAAHEAPARSVRSRGSSRHPDARRRPRADRPLRRRRPKTAAAAGQGRAGKRRRRSRSSRRRAPSRPPEKAEIKPVPKPPKSRWKSPPKGSPKETPNLRSSTRSPSCWRRTRTSPPPSRPRNPNQARTAPSAGLRPILRKSRASLSRRTPSAAGSTGGPSEQVASLGAPTLGGAHVALHVGRSSTSSCRNNTSSCWNFIAPPTGRDMSPKFISNLTRPDGSLAGQPVLTNPPSDPQSRALADSALRAVRRCNPLKIPAQFQPYFEQWKDWMIGFDPDNMRLTTDRRQNLRNEECLSHCRPARLPCPDRRPRPSARRPARARRVPSACSK